jgi:sigma-E factor negative regulatory protein RseA
MVDLRVMTDTSTNQKRKVAPKADTEAALGSVSKTDAVGTGTDAVGESLSALMDSEASEMEVHRLLKLTEQDPEVRERWRRYQLMRSVIKNELDADPQFDLSAQISAAIHNEQPLRTDSRLKRWSHGAGKVAIAASVAFAFIVGVQQLGPMGTTPKAEVANPVTNGVEAAGQVATESRSTVPAGFELPPFAARTVSTGGAAREAAPQLFNSLNSSSLNGSPSNNSRALQQHFDQLLIKHAERASAHGNMGLLPFARVPSLEAADD